MSNLSDTQHTPGSWEVLTAPDHQVRPRYYIHPKDDCECLADVYETDEKEGEANARLIAAAPDMLVALKAIRICLDNGSRRAMIEAIAKAEGTET